MEKHVLSPKQACSQFYGPAFLEFNGSVARQKRKRPGRDMSGVITYPKKSRDLKD